MRHLALAAALAALALPAAAQDCAEGMRAFEHALGTTCIPESPQRIVAPRGDSIATPLIEMGAALVGTGFRQMDDGTVFIRGATDILGADAVAAAGLSDVGNPNQPDLEKIAQLEPDLIIIQHWLADGYEQY
jgi:iron complex transport system substrate-binding protein